MQYRDFKSDDLFNSAYKPAIQHATSTDFDPHIRWLARILEYFLKISLPGKCIEIGTTYGFMFYFALSKLEAEGFDFKDSQIYLFDKFDQRKLDRSSGSLLTEIEIRYADDKDAVQSAFERFKVVKCIQGLVPEVLESIDVSEISFLHIDLNAAKPEVDSLRMLWPHLVPNTIVLLVDYGFLNFDSTRLAHCALAEELGYEILGLPTGLGLIITTT